MIECSGLDLEQLEIILDSSVQSVEALQRTYQHISFFFENRQISIQTEGDCHTALASCQPTPALYSYLSTIVKQIAETPGIVHKATLFIKPEDLIGTGVNLSIQGVLEKHQSRCEDTITKGIVLSSDPYLICSRCGGSSNVLLDLQSSRFLSERWRVWEKMWTLRCICGGLWASRGEDGL